MPYIASGGFANGRGLAAAIALGAAVSFCRTLSQETLKVLHPTGCKYGCVNLPNLTIESSQTRLLGTRFMCTVERYIYVCFSGSSFR